MIETNIIEIFSSIQGEGKYVGYRQVFIRFSGCNLHCTYCDTKLGVKNIVTPSFLPVPENSPK